LLSGRKQFYIPPNAYIKKENYGCQLLLHGSDSFGAEKWILGN
jgi:hypothetical protein